MAECGVGIPSHSIKGSPRQEGVVHDDEEDEQALALLAVWKKRSKRAEEEMGGGRELRDQGPGTSLPHGSPGSVNQR